MPKYTVTKRMLHDGKSYDAGDTVDMSADDAARYGGLVKPVTAKRAKRSSSSESEGSGD